MTLYFSEDKIKERIQFENPWWNDARIDPRFRSLKHRGYFNSFFKLVQERKPQRAVVLMGPRRVGKTVMIYHAIQELIKKGVPEKNICFISLDTPIYTGCLLEELLNLFLQVHKPKKKEQLYVFFDEIQYLKNWEVHLKSLVDSYHSVKFVASGSAAAALKLKSNESGAGRFTDFILPPLTFAEYLVITGQDDIKNLPALRLIQRLNKELLNYINYGGYPEVSLSKEAQKDLGRYVLSDIVDKVLLKDIPSLYGIQDVQELKSFFNYIAYHTGQEFSIEKLASNSGIAKNTIKKYIEYLEAAFLIKKLSRIDQNAKTFKREVTFKLYLTNPSLRSALFSPVTPDDPFIGHIIENTVYAQMLHTDIRQLYYARWEKGEIDFVELDNLQHVQNVLEIKWSDKAVKDKTELKQLVAFCHNTQPVKVQVTTKTELKKTVVHNVSISFIPVAFQCLNFSGIFADKLQPLKQKIIQELS